MLPCIYILLRGISMRKYTIEPKKERTWWLGTPSIMSRISTGLAEAGRRFATEDGRLLLRFAEGARPAIPLHTVTRVD